MHLKPCRSSARIGGNKKSPSDVVAASMSEGLTALQTLKPLAYSCHQRRSLEGADRASDA
jgi:hypothetical protein